MAGEAESGLEREAQKGRLVTLSLQSELHAARENATSLRVQLDKALSGVRGHFLSRFLSTAFGTIRTVGL